MIIFPHSRKYNMSSTITHSDRQTLAKFGHQSPKQGKKEKLTRTASIDKINAYICSQNYYMLPAIFYWIKTSLLHSSAEKFVFYLRSAIYATYLVKLIESKVKDLTSIDLQGQLRGSKVKMYALTLFDQIFLIVRDVREKSFSLFVYSCVLGVFLQFSTLLYFLKSMVFPKELIFLFTCLYLITHFKLKILVFYWNRKFERKSRKEDYIQRLSPKKILANRTISNVNFFKF